MKKQRKTASRKSKRTKSDTSPEVDQPRRSFLKLARNGGIGLAVIGGVSFFSVRAVRATMAEQDLTRVGNGRPSIVQIHDPQCPLCTALQRVARKALRNFDEGDVTYLVADIRTQEGSAFAARYGVPHVTLLLFDGRGTLVRTLNGPQERDYLTQVFTDHLEAHG